MSLPDDTSIMGPGYLLSSQTFELENKISVRRPTLDRPSIFPGGRFPRQGLGQLLVDCQETGTRLFRDRRLEDHGFDRYVMYNGLSAQLIWDNEDDALWFRELLRTWAS